MSHRPEADRARGLLRRPLPALLAFSLSACASVPMAPTDADAEGKRFPPPPPGQATLYVLRGGGLGAAVPIGATIGQRSVGSLAPFTWFRVDVAPGPQDVRCVTREVERSVVVEMAPGETRFVQLGAEMGWVTARCWLEQVPPEQGRAVVMTGQRAAEVR